MTGALVRAETWAPTPRECLRPIFRTSAAKPAVPQKSSTMLSFSMGWFCTLSRNMSRNWDAGRFNRWLICVSPWYVCDWLPSVAAACLATGCVLKIGALEAEKKTSGLLVSWDPLRRCTGILMHLRCQGSESVFGRAILI